MFDLAFAGLGLVVLSPLFAVGAILVKLSGSGPILFRQQRVGMNFVPFTIYKFRTMSAEAPQHPPITIRGDPRITGVGQLLRRTKLDEIPQLINVLKGEMSLVGPRPEVPDYVALFKYDYADILTVRPGITDEASVRFRDEEAILAAAPDAEESYVKEVLPKKIALAKEYLRKRSMTHDLLIILRTLARV